MNTITTQQQKDIDKMLNRFYDKESQVFLINHFSEKASKNLNELSLLQAYRLHNYLAIDVLKESKILYVVALAYQNEMYDIYSPDLTANHLNTFNHLAQQQFKKNLYHLSLEELEEFVKPFIQIENNRQEREKVKQQSDNYQQATKATNALLKSLSIPKEKATRKQSVKGK